MEQSTPDLDRTVSVILSEMKQMARPGMTPEEFFDEVLPGGDEIGANDQVHKLIDAVWDWLEARGWI